MKKGIMTLGVIAMITVVCWLMTMYLYDVSLSGKVTLLNQFSQFLGALALVALAGVNYISTRHGSLDRFFNGLDKAYIVHKWLGIISMCLIAAHCMILTGAMSGNVNDFYHVGVPSLILFIVLISMALLARKMNYQRWKAIHKIMALPYGIGLVHYYGSSVYGAFGFSPFSIWMNVVNLIGVVSLIYSIFFYEKTAFPYQYKVTAVRTVAKDTVEVTGRAVAKTGESTGRISGKDVTGTLSFRPGQFTFVKFPEKGRKFPSHPFTLSGAVEKGGIQFTIKNLGDHTAKLIAAVSVDDTFAVTGPHGVFDYKAGGKRQIWIAAGIGITPFRSCYLSDIPKDFSIDFFYAYHGEEEGVYLDELRALKKSNLRLHLIDDTQQGFLTVEKIKKQIPNTQADMSRSEKDYPPKTPVDIYFCGPRPMRNELRKGLKNSDICVAGFRFEEFQFGR